MEQAMVEAAAYVIGPGSPPDTHETNFIRLLKDPDRAKCTQRLLCRRIEQGQAIGASSQCVHRT